jgi:general secretion pathway protein D
VLHPASDSRYGARAALLALCIVTAGCASSKAMHRGSQAEGAQDYDIAVAEYNKAAHANPNDVDARDALNRAKLRASQDHFTKGRRAAAIGKYDQALVEYEAAAELNPSSGDIDAEVRATRTKLRLKVAVPREGKTELQTIIDRTRDLPPPGMDLPQGVKMPASLTFRDASSRDVFTAMARLANISVIFDSAFREAPVTVDLRNAMLDDALTTLSGATRTFFRVTAPRTIIVIPDTPAKRREYEEEIVRTFYLSNADLKETMDLLRVVLDARRLSPTTALNAVTIKDTPEHIAAAARVLTAIDKARPEVLIDVELIEVDRTKMSEYGLQIATAGSTGINGSVGVATDSSGNVPLSTLKNLSQSDILMAGLPSLYYRLLKSDQNTRTLANPQLRTTDGATATAKFGQQVPVPVTTFAPIATGGTPQQPITSYNYQNIGVNIDITPRTHHDDNVTLNLKVSVTNIAGTGFGNLPTFGNREINTVITLRDGETNMLAGLIRNDESKTHDGIPGLSDMPLVGQLFGHTTTNREQTDVILTLTPHVIRVLDLTESDLRPFRVGGRDTGAPVIEPPIVPPPAPIKPPEDAVDPLAPKKPGGGRR